MTDLLNPNIYFMYRHILHIECIAVIHVILVTTAIFSPLAKLVNWFFVTEVECVYFAVRLIFNNNSG
jgi:hypothetical protein